ncbi:FliM/FliN family flagellar motor switch protein [Siccibacter turicensis]|uniref:FliM/FliN family flagellar motor switch protein n=1 Tax=Siccibacter turicensis TaxID=357233 RepID=UPI003F57A0C7
MKPLALRRQRRIEAQLRQKTGAGWRFRFDTDEASGWLELHLTAQASGAVQARGLACQAGTLWLSEPEAVCGLLSSCPALPDAARDQAWYWPLYNQAMCAPLQDLLGAISPSDADVPPDDLLWLSLTVVLGDARAHSALGATPETLTHLLAHVGWQPLYAPADEALSLSLPLNLGALTLPLAQLRALRPDDVILPTRTWFTPTGEGELHLARVRIQGELQGEEGRAGRFYITDLEITDVNVTPDDYAMDGMPQPDDERPAAPATETSAFDPLPLALTLRCGHLRLTLGEINRLSVGTTLMVDHVVPGEALLCHGDFPLAKGELVDVEGRLGLQITHMLPAAANPLDADR